MIEKVLLFLHNNEYLLPVIILAVLLLFVNMGIYFRYAITQQRNGKNYIDAKLFSILLIEIVLSLPMGVGMALASVANGTEITQEELGLMKSLTINFPLFWAVVVISATIKGQIRLNRKRKGEQKV